MARHRGHVGQVCAASPRPFRFEPASTALSLLEGARQAGLRVIHTREGHPQFHTATLDMLAAQGGIVGWVGTSTNFLAAIASMPAGVS